jgi:DNA polymerase alpha subunit A
MEADEKPAPPIKAELVDVKLPKAPVNGAAVKKEENPS